MILALLLSLRKCLSMPVEVGAEDAEKSSKSPGTFLPDGVAMEDK